MDTIQTLGTIVLWAGATPPDGWLFCDGAIIQRTDDYTPLFTVLFDQFGGDGETTYGLPKLDNVGSKRYIICSMGELPTLH